jgi:hypothetical protein
VSTTNMWEELFGGGRKWRVAEELTGDQLTTAGPGEPDILVRFDRGWFSMEPPGAYRSPLSTNLGRRGVVLVRTDASGSSDVPGSRIAIGVHALRRARQEFSAVW